MISTKGRYCIRVLIDLAQNYKGTYIPMKEVAARQELSLKYLEKILPILTKNKLVEGIHGKGGGYKLTRAPEDYTVWEILELAEESMAPVSCLNKDAAPCSRVAECATLQMWKDYYKLTENYFSSITIADLIKNKPVDNYVI